MNGGTRMQYPSFPGQFQVNTGDLPSLYDMGPPDLRASGHNPYYDVYSASRGRQLGAVEASVDNADGRSADVEGLVSQLKHQTSANEMKDYPALLDELAHMDDVQGNGVFDPAGSHGNIHPDEGIFAEHDSIPGYLARERFFRPSEVVDVNTGNPVVYVPGNAFMLDPRTDEMLALRNLYEPGLPSTGGGPVEMASTWIPNQPGWAVGAAEGETREPASGATMFVAAAIAGAALGLFAGMVAPKRR